MAITSPNIEGLVNRGLPRTWDELNKKPAVVAVAPRGNTDELIDQSALDAYYAGKTQEQVQNMAVFCLDSEIERNHDAS